MSAHQNPPGRLARCLKQETPEYQIALEIEAALGIDHAYPAPKNITDLLLEFLLPLLETNPKASSWLAVLSQIQTSEDGKKWRQIAPSGPDRNPLNRNFSQYPICSYLLQVSHHETTSQSDGIKLAFLHTMLQRSSDHKLTKHANDLRIATRPQSQELEILKSLPEFAADFIDYHKNLRNTVAQKARSGPSALLHSLRTLLELAPVRRLSSASQPNIKSAAPASAPKGIDITSRISTGYITTFESQVGSATEGEPPEFDDIITTIFDLDDSLSDADPELLSPLLLSEASADFEARKSEYWLRRHDRLVPTDFGRFTILERRHLATYIKTEICSPDAEQRIAAGLIGTMYVTGIGLNTLLQTLIGPDRTLSNSGIYIREIHRPTGAFTPSEAQLADLQSLATRLLLPLPEPIASWISSHCTFEATQLGDRLCLSSDTATNLIKEALRKLRTYTNLQRIRLERIPAALALETTLAYQDPLITYLLASTEQQAPPKLAYYAAYPTKLLVESYTEVTGRMLSP
jgi:hypothetical protein